MVARSACGGPFPYCGASRHPRLAKLPVVFVAMGVGIRKPLGDGGMACNAKSLEGSADVSLSGPAAEVENEETAAVVFTHPIPCSALQVCDVRVDGVGDGPSWPDVCCVTLQVSRG